MKKLSSPIDLIKKSLSIFFEKENMKLLVLISLPLLPFSLITLFKFKQTWLAWILGGSNLVYFLVYVLVAPALIVAVDSIVSKNKLSLKEIFAKAWKFYWKFLLLTVLLSLIIGFGFILLIIPGIIFMVWFSFSTFILVTQKEGVKKSLLKSKDLVKGRFWPVFGRMIVFGIFAFLVQIVISIIPFGIGGVVSTLLSGLFVLPSYLLYKEISG